MNDVLLLCCCFEWDGKGKNVQSHLGLAYSIFCHWSLFLKRLLISGDGHNLVFFGSSQPENGIIGTVSRKSRAWWFLNGGLRWAALGFK